MDTIFYLFNVNLHFIAMQTSGANAITLHIVQKEQCTPNVFSATHSTLLVVPLPLEDTSIQCGIGAPTIGRPTHTGIGIGAYSYRLMQPQN